MTPLLARLKHQRLMLLCIGACVLPLAMVLLLGRYSLAPWLLLAPCLLMHLLMMKKTGSTSCHQQEHHNSRGQSDKPH